MTDIDLVQGDITRLEVDAIVNAANSSLMGGGGVDGAIHRVGGPSIRAECEAIVREHGPLETGKAVITGGGLLSAQFVIHTVGPVWFEHGAEEAVELLTSCYRNSLDLAARNECRAVAFPSISTGAYGFPIALAAHTAIRAVEDWISDRSDALATITFVCFDQGNFEIYRAGLKL